MSPAIGCPNPTIEPDPRPELVTIDGVTDGRPSPAQIACLALWGRRAWLWCVIAMLQGLMFSVGDARAQSSGEDPEQPTSTESVPAGRSGRGAGPGLPQAGTGEVRINVVSFGYGRFRPGDWTGILIETQDSSPRERNIIVRVEIRDNDGDTAWYERRQVTNPNAKQSVWIYARIPMDFDRGSSEFKISAFEAVQVGSEDSENFRAGRMLGQIRYRTNNNQAVSPYSDVIGVVGSRTAGLEQLSWARPGNQNDPTTSITGHQVTELAGPLPLLEGRFPDRWMGLAPFRTLLWSSTSAETQPSVLSREQADALMEWVRRGGHLVVIIPTVAQGWIDSPANRLSDIMPRVKLTRREGVDLRAYSGLLTRDARVVLPNDTVLHTFAPASADTATDPAAYQWEPGTTPIMSGVDGEPVVIRRVVGSGAVTLIGLDVLNQRLMNVAGAMQADRFWNRILGLRAPLISPADLDAKQNPRTPNTAAQYKFTSSQSIETDDYIGSMIASQGKAITGVLLAVIIFGLYFALAGPLGYFGLRARGMKQHAWVGFVIVAAVFTVIAWSGANILKIRTVQGRHLTFVDSVYGETSHKARSWVSIVLPQYGTQRLSIAQTDGVPANNTIAPWESFSATGASGLAAFPDSRGYSIDVRNPASFSVPARATAKELQVDWLGLLPTGWGMIGPGATDTSVPVGQEIVLRERANPATPQERKWELTGSIVHKFPKPLKNVMICLVRGQGRAQPPGVPAEAVSVIVAADEWAADTELVLDKQFTPNAPGGSVMDTMLASMTPAPRANLGMTVQESVDPVLAARRASFFSMLAPPDPTAYERVIMRQTMSHSLDLSRWLTQPCLIVIAEMEDSPLPIPLAVDSIASEEVRKRVVGRTIVRWVYPLTGRPVRPDALPQIVPEPPKEDLTAPL